MQDLSVITEPYNNKVNFVLKSQTVVFLHNEADSNFENNFKMSLFPFLCMGNVPAFSVLIDS